MKKNWGHLHVQTFIFWFFNFLVSSTQILQFSWHICVMTNAQRTYIPRFQYIIVKYDKYMFHQNHKNHIFQKKTFSIDLIFKSCFWYMLFWKKHIFWKRAYRNHIIRNIYSLCYVCFYNKMDQENTFFAHTVKMILRVSNYVFLKTHIHQHMHKIEKYKSRWFSQIWSNIMTPMKEIW